MTAVEIATPRLVLRDFTPADETAFIACQDDPTRTHSLLLAFAEWRMARPRINFQLAVCRRDRSETLVGCCGLRREGLPSGIAEYGLELAPAWQGRYRYAVEITDAMLYFGFETLRLGEIVGRTTEANERVHRLAQWYGASLRAHSAGAVEWRITRAAWRAGAHGRRSARRSPD